MMTKAFPFAKVVVALFSIWYAAFAGAQTSSPATESATLPPGTVLSVELSKSLDAKKSKLNDKIEAKTASDLLLHGQIALPRNTKIVGHITEVKVHSKSSPGSEIKFTFDHLLLKRGSDLPLQLTVQAIARPLRVPSFGSGGPDNMPDTPSMPGRVPSMGSQTPVGAASSATINPKYPDDMTPPPTSANNSDIPSPSTATPLSATTRGVVGIKGLTLNASGPISILTSGEGNVHLESGSQLALRVQ
jgi:hypothetical protein